MTEFVRNSVPGFPPNLTLERFILHMTTHHPTIVKTLTVWKEDEARTESGSDPPGFDLLLNPERTAEMFEKIAQTERETAEIFSKMDFSSEKTREAEMGQDEVRVKVN